MTSNLNSKIYTYEPATIARAKKALSCSPFCLRLFQDMRNQSVPIQQIAGMTGIQFDYVTKAYSEAKTEDKLCLVN